MLKEGSHSSQDSQTADAVRAAGSNSAHDAAGEAVANALRNLRPLTTIPAKKRHTLICGGELLEGKYVATDRDLESIRDLTAAALALLAFTPKAQAAIAKAADQ